MKNPNHKKVKGHLEKASKHHEKAMKHNEAAKKALGSATQEKKVAKRTYKKRNVAS